MKPKAAEMIPFSLQYLGIPYSEMDCQAFIEACLRDVGININLPGSNAWYRHCTWTGTPEECIEAFGSIPLGAFLFIWKEDGAPSKYDGDGIGNASHIGLYTDQGLGAIHSSQSKCCVCESEFKEKTIKHGGWNRVGLDQNLLDYGLDQQDPAGEDYKMTAIVTAPTGNTVRMRAKPSSTCIDYVHVPVGSTVEVLNDLSPVDGWTHIMYQGKTGYMMTKFLEEQLMPEITLPDMPTDDTMVSVMLPYSIATVLYNALSVVMGGTENGVG